jgi:hypothetical protein
MKASLGELLLTCLLEDDRRSNHGPMVSGPPTSRREPEGFRQRREEHVVGRGLTKPGPL